MRQSSKLGLIAAGVVWLSSNAASATVPQSVVDLLAEGYEIVSFSPITGSYAFVRKKGGAVVICQVGFDDAAKDFKSEVCYPLSK